MLGFVLAPLILFAFKPKGRQFNRYLYEDFSLAAFNFYTFALEKLCS